MKKIKEANQTYETVYSPEVKVRHWLDVCLKNSNESWGEPLNINFHNYWEGQLMGACHILARLGLEEKYDTKEYLKQAL